MSGPDLDRAGKHGRTNMIRPNPAPQVVHTAIEEIRQIASQNVIAVLGAQIDILGAKVDSQGAEIRAEIKAQTARIDVLQRVIWPLIGLRWLVARWSRWESSHAR